MSYFGTDGIRGTVGEFPLTPEFVLRLGAAVGAVLQSDTINNFLVVGRDTRESGQMLQSALVSGLLASGINVYDLGVITSPGVAWIVNKLGGVGGAVLSASHNPADQNGIKIFGSGGQKLEKDVEKAIDRLISLHDSGDFWSKIPSQRFGSYFDGQSMVNLYMTGLISEHEPQFLRGVKIVVDCSNGAASKIAPSVFDNAGAKVVALNASPTGLNINVDSGSEYVRKAPWKLGELIVEHGADFGLAFDGDADRVVFVDETGNLVDGDHILGILAKYLLSKSRLLDNTVVTTVMRNEGLKIFLEKNHLNIIETPVGDKYVVEQLVGLQSSEKAPKMIGLGGEQSGHIVILDDYHFTGDGIRTALYVMRAWVENNRGSMAAFAEGIGKTPQVIASADVKVGGNRLSPETLSGTRDAVQKNYPTLSRINLRYSGTEPKFRVMLEGDRQMGLDALAKIAWELCRTAQSYSGLNFGEIEILNCTTGGVVDTSDFDLEVTK